MSNEKKDQKPKKLLDIREISQLTEPSLLRRTVIVGAKGIQGAAGGLGLGGLVATIVAAAGLSSIMALVLLQAITASAGALIFGGLAMLFAGYQIWQDNKNIEKKKKEFTEEVAELRKSLIDLLRNYQLLEEMKTSYPEQVEKWDALQKEIRVRLQIILNEFSGKKNTEKLAEIFGIVEGHAAGQGAIVNYASKVLSWKAVDSDRVKKALGLIWGDTLNKPLDTDKDFQDQLDKKIRPTKDISGKAIKGHHNRAVYAATAIGGFLGGSGLTITVAALVVGGAAALIAVGWPIVVAAIGIGILAAAGSFFYYRFIQKKQEKTNKRLDTVTSQVKGITSYINDTVNKPVNQLENDQKKKLEGKFELLEDQVKSISKSIAQNKIKVKGMEMKHSANISHTGEVIAGSQSSLANIELHRSGQEQSLAQAIQENIKELELTKQTASLIKLTPEFTARKAELFAEIEANIKSAAESLKTIVEMDQDHPQKTRVASEAPTIILGDQPEQDFQNENEIEKFK